MPVEDGDQFKAVAAHAVGDDVGRVGNDQFPGAENSPRSSDVRVGLEQFNRVQNALSDKSSILPGILGYECSERDQMLYGAAGPDDFHRGPFASPLFPQVFSHLETVSWPTVFPDSRSAKPL